MVGMKNCQKISRRDTPIIENKNLSSIINGLAEIRCVIIQAFCRRSFDSNIVKIGVSEANMIYHVKQYFDEHLVIQCRHF
ncbi:hypothetical protein THOM_0624 [Trachipleistophora hominis]|uniref:Uncharacterized protein n=1 Tax=Trachipleistophora hominis TaxID=72359 RepID=L7JY82_TRAHO|nr:hypothetical protein THOM_0624 [Trachipleistophora hominis]